MSDLRKSRWFGATLALAWLVAVYLVLPMIIVLPVSVTDQRFLSLPHHGVSFKHYEALVSNPVWLSSIWRSLFVAGLSTVFTVTLGTLAAIGCWRIASRSSEMVRAVLLLPMIVPSIVHALGIYRMWINLDIIDSFFGVILAHTITGIPFVVIAVSAALSNFDVRLERAARNLGATMWQTMRWVILPNIVPGIGAGAVFAFVHSWDEIVVLLFIAGRKIYLLPRAIWDGVHENIDPSIASIATILIVLTLFAMLAERWWRGRSAAVKN